MPARLRPTAPIAADAILVGDPGRALMLAQELLEQPKMSNHARGLWGYSGRTSEGRELTIQATGMGGPSAAVVLGDLAELGVRRAIRIGTCASLGALSPGELLIVTEAQPFRGSLGLSERAGALLDREEPDPVLTRQLREALPAVAGGVAVSLDHLHDPRGRPPSLPGDVADMQTAALFGAGRAHRVAVAAVLIVVEKNGEEPLDDANSETAAKQVGHVASGLLSTLG